MLGEQFARAIAARDTDAVAALLADDVDFKALTPRRFWEGNSPAEVLDTVFGHWFGESDHIDALAGVESGETVGDTSRVAYRFHITNPDGTHVVEQQVYYREADDKLAYLRVVCSGYRPLTS
ncbi:hypothetical protein [Actinokineospora sp. HUAS TT18]|uniref:hypothetical protein n=1 Tax=Actinokineospora sp. HUAS TT18 TaxID=3447451 RepID=UPI003F52848F